ncbi:UDP-glycosyltransferase 79B3-like [Lotus japonicus]|uniref:UDP-glycosyltransferase 79B3-like n=1 Tax=Lotus japonicus TaxID=34305 RepID=UPI00258621F8|nr:UDP-glycosyltransferase 79B3-like [Lotus japonicus]
MATSNTSKLHIAMLPWFATGHMTPFLQLSNEFAKRGHKVSFFLPPKAELELQHMNYYPHLITFHTLTVPHVDGLPLGTETASEIPIGINNLLQIAMDKTSDQVDLALSKIKPDFLFFDHAHWISQIANKYGIKTIFYHVMCAASIAIKFVPAKNVPRDRLMTLEELGQLPAGYPSSKVVLLGPEAIPMDYIQISFGEGNMTFHDRLTMALKQSDAIAIRTTREIKEGDFCDYIAAQYQKPVLLTGPVLPKEAYKGELEEHWAKWLDGFEPTSVVFCAFGSQVNLKKEQFQELLLGFELSGFPFFIALKTPLGCASVDEALPEGFEERVKGRGVVARDWVQQPLILKHPSVGCFVSHCGFGSMWESLMSDKQIVLVPFLADQALNAKLLVEELQVAVSVERGKNWRDIITKESFCKAIKSVMDERSDLATRLKNNHAKFKELLGNPALMNGYIDRFIEDLQQLPK